MTLSPVTLHIHGKPVILTVETLAKTFTWFADNQRACAAAAKAGEFFVNDLARYTADCEAHAAAYDRHETSGNRLSLTFLQRAYFIQSGESVPMLSA